MRRAMLPGVFVGWHLLSLDAPTVAVVWAWALARAAGVQVSWSTVAVLGLGTWLIYVGDRLMDVRPGAHRADLRERHFFHARHRGALLAAGAAAGVPLLWLIAEMPAAARWEDSAVFAAAMLYFVLVHVPVVRTRWRMPFLRELVVAVLFAAATLVPAWSEAGAKHGELAAVGLLFAGLCWVNCAGIHVWERRARDVRVQVLAVLGAVMAEAVMLTAVRPEMVLLAAAGLAAAALLFGLDRLAERGSASLLTVRVLADAALLTPLLLVLWRT